MAGVYLLMEERQILVFQQLSLKDFSRRNHGITVKNRSTLDVIWIWLWIDPATTLYVVNVVKVARAAWFLTWKQTAHALVVSLTAVLLQALSRHLLAAKEAEVEVLPDIGKTCQHTKSLDFEG